MLHFIYVTKKCRMHSFFIKAYIHCIKALLTFFLSIPKITFFLFLAKIVHISIAAEHPKFKHHKEDLHNVIKKAEKHLKKLHRKFEKLYQTGDAKKAKDKQMKAIKKWMSSLTKINTDG